MSEQKMREAVRDAIAEALGDAYDCTRVWAAWGVGTMGPDDFSLVREDSDRLDEIADAALQEMARTGAQPEQRGEVVMETCGDCDPCIGGRPDQCAVGGYPVFRDAPAPAVPDAVYQAIDHARNVLAEIYAKYSLKIGPYASQAQVANGELARARAMLAATPEAPRG